MLPIEFFRENYTEQIESYWTWEAALKYDVSPLQYISRLQFSICKERALQCHVVRYLSSAPTM